MFTVTRLSYCKIKRHWYIFFFIEQKASIVADFAVSKSQHKHCKDIIGMVHDAMQEGRVAPKGEAKQMAADLMHVEDPRTQD